MRDPLFILAFDHRASLPATLKMNEDLEEARPALERAKTVVFDGLVAAADGLDPGTSALLVDEQLGAAVARRVRDAGLVLAMPVERSGEALFEFEYPDWKAHIERFEPDLVKVLVRWNPLADREGNARQGERLAQLSSWLTDHGRPLMLELLVPATDAQAMDDRYDTDVRPELAAGAMREIRDAGVEPRLWKLEGVDRPEDARELSRTAREGGRGDVRCVILGRGADPAQVDRWLRVAAPVEGFAGFAIGRSIWAEPLRAWLAHGPSPDRTAKAVAENYLAFVDVYERALAAAR